MCSICSRGFRHISIIISLFLCRNLNRRNKLFRVICFFFCTADCTATTYGIDVLFLVTTKYNFQKSPTDSLGTLSTLTPSDEQLDSLSLFHKKSQIPTFRMYDIPAIISLPHQIVFCPYLLTSTNFCRSFFE